MKTIETILSALYASTLPRCCAAMRLARRATFRALLTLALAGAATLLARTASAQAWQTVDDFQYVAGQAAVNFGLAVAPSGALFASGFAYDASGVGHGLVMASADAGNTWSAPLDDFVYPGGTGTWTTMDNFPYVSGANAHAIAADSLGNVFVGGQGSPASGAVHWLVRKN